jgi:hypothetical protein
MSVNKEYGIMENKRNICIPQISSLANGAEITSEM